jgi:hypothetical protein
LARIANIFLTSSGNAYVLYLQPVTRIFGQNLRKNPSAAGKFLAENCDLGYNTSHLIGYREKTCFLPNSVLELRISNGKQITSGRV